MWYKNFRNLRCTSVPLMEDNFQNPICYIAIKELCKWFEIIPVSVKFNALNLDPNLISVKIPVLLYNDWFKKYGSVEFIKNITLQLPKKAISHTEPENLVISYITTDKELDKLYLCIMFE